ncbi:citrate/2-methylcitrate synthase [Saccharopolyspora spinosa]|uniref:citrate/2-methylcitrate synthase n=1 Tax=Saccharopolyspora spinosa TaxID=60894 RepID=UPI0002ECB305|nr:citrate/2-methylcitrate synthase [Saccharopolyspora spinosa]
MRRAARDLVASYRAVGRHIPGFGHHFHLRDPRRDPLLELVAEAVEAGEVPGRALEAGPALEAAFAEGRSRPVPMNIDGATAIVYSELGFPPELRRGLFVLSRSVGVLAHTSEETKPAPHGKSGDGFGRTARSSHLSTRTVRSLHTSNARYTTGSLL